MRGGLFWPGAVLASSATLMVAEGFDLGPPLAPILALWFLLVCPGVSYVRLLRLGEPLTEFLLTVAFSVSIGALASLALLAGQVWTPGRTLLVVVGIAVVGAGIDAYRVVATRRESVVGVKWHA